MLILPLLPSQVAASKGKTSAQVAINWCMCKGAVPIPGAKSLTQVMGPHFHLLTRPPSATTAFLRGGHSRAVLLLS